MSSIKRSANISWRFRGYGFFIWFFSLWFFFKKPLWISDKILRQGSQKIYFFISNLASKKSKLKIVQPLHPSCSSSRQGLLVSRGMEEVEKEHQLWLRQRPDLNLEMTTLVILTGLSWSLNCWTKDVYYHQKASREVKRQLYKKKRHAQFKMSWPSWHSFPSLGMYSMAN